MVACMSIQVSLVRLLPSECSASIITQTHMYTRCDVHCCQGQ